MMDVMDMPSVDPNIDYEKILPIHQKRIIAFINHFITNTVSFLNSFSQSCESRLMEFEYKLQKIEASILILESQLSSISSLNELDDSNRQELQQPESQKAEVVELPTLPSEAQTQSELPKLDNTTTGSKASEDPRFIKFFKMVQFGVPVDAVKNKMALEGFDPTILDKPNEVVPGYEANPMSSSSSSTS